MDRETAIALLVDRFPEILTRVDSPQDAFVAPPYLAYGLFAQEIVGRKGDEAFLSKASGFIDDLAESGDPVLEEVLVVSVLERVAEDASLTDKLKAKLRERARSMMQQVEAGYFGRTT
jgi:hypothetical protein